MSFHGYSDAQLVRIARGEAPKRSAFLSALRAESLAPLHRPKQPLPTVYSGDPMPPPVPTDASDGHIRKIAKRLAYYCASDFPGAADEIEIAAHLHNVCRLHDVELPDFGACTGNMQPAFARLSCPRWWRRRLRSSVARRTERQRIREGVVHRAAQVYCSDAGVHRRRESAKRNHDLMTMIDALNETTGELVSLADLAARSTSNPELRRNELMTRCKGLEQIADARGDRGLFVTWTLPSRFHPIRDGGQRNPKWDGSDPKAGAAWFAVQWARVRAALAKAVIPANKRFPDELRGLTLYGIRVAEPHHDETPHWHLLLFAPLRWHRMITATIAQYAFAEGDEPGAKKARFEAKLISKGIDPKTGKARSAVGYVAKYLAKNVDGFQLEFTMERGADGDLHFTGAGATAAERIRAWASTWGIRQFQFFGTPPVTIYRELRRVPEPVPQLTTEAARITADAGDYAGHVMAVGGVAVPRDALRLATHREEPTDSAGRPLPTRYGDAAALVVKGVAEVLAGPVQGARLLALPLITRLHRWTIQEPRAAGPLAPRTRVNNCNRSENDERSERSHLEQRQPGRSGWIKPADAGRILESLGWRSDLDPERDDGDLDGIAGFA